MVESRARDRWVLSWLNSILEWAKFIPWLVLLKICWNLRCNRVKTIIWIPLNWRHRLETIWIDRKRVWSSCCRFEIILSDRERTWWCCRSTDCIWSWSNERLGGKSIGSIARLHKWVDRCCPKTGGASTLQKGVGSCCLRLLVRHEWVGRHLWGLYNRKNLFFWLILWLRVDEINRRASRSRLAVLWWYLFKLKLDLNLLLLFWTRCAQAMALKWRAWLLMFTWRLLLDLLLEYWLFLNFQNWIFRSYFLRHHLWLADSGLLGSFVFAILDLLVNSLGKINFLWLFTLFLSL